MAFEVAPEFTGWHAAVLQQLSAQYAVIVGPAAQAQEAMKAVPAALAAHPALAGVPEARLRAQVWSLPPRAPPAPLVSPPIRLVPSGCRFMISVHNYDRHRSFVACCIDDIYMFSETSKPGAEFHPIPPFAP